MACFSFHFSIFRSEYKITKWQASHPRETIDFPFYQFPIRTLNLNTNFQSITYQLHEISITLTFLISHNLVVNTLNSLHSEHWALKHWITETCRNKKLVSIFIQWNLYQKKHLIEVISIKMISIISHVREQKKSL